MGLCDACDGMLEVCCVVAYISDGLSVSVSSRLAASGVPGANFLLFLTCVGGGAECAGECAAEVARNEVRNECWAIASCLDSRV